MSARRFAIFSLLCGFFVGSCSAEETSLNDYVNVGASGGAAAQTTTGGGSETTRTGETGHNGVTTNPDSDICAKVNVHATRVIPWIMFVVDRSGSTEEEYSGSTSRWQAIYDALMTPKTGVIDKLQHVANFGMLLFDGGDIIELDPCESDPSCEGPAYLTPDCPRLVTVNPALGNYKAINAKYKISPPGSSTPAAFALEAAYKLRPSQRGVLDQVIGPEFVVYCTDGEPNSCENGSVSMDFEARQSVIDKVTAAAQGGTKTYVIGVAVNDNTQNHLTEVAQAGNSGAPAYSPSTQAELTKVISKIVTGSVGCNLKLSESVTPGKECDGSVVVLNSKSLKCNDPNGWKLTDQDHIKLLGTACDSFLYNPTAILSATFPCEAVLVE